MVKRVALALQPRRRPMAHVHVEIISTGVTGAVEHLLELTMARVEAVRLGREPVDEIRRQVGFEKAFRLLHHAFGDPFGREQRVAFELGGQSGSHAAERSEPPSTGQRAGGRAK